MELSKELQDLLENIQSLNIDKEKKKVICTLSGHEMPPRVDAVQSYLIGKKYIKLKKNKEFEDEFAKYKEHIMPSDNKRNKHQFFCKLTLRHMNSDPEHIKKHIHGKRFLKALKRWEECQLTGETFKPRTFGRKQFADQDQDEQELDPKRIDDMLDLYPELATAGTSDSSGKNSENNGKDASADDDEDDDDDFIDLSDEEVVETVSNGVKTGQKRKLNGNNEDSNSSVKKHKKKKLKTDNEPTSEKKSKKKKKKKSKESE